MTRHLLLLFVACSTNLGIKAEEYPFDRLFTDRLQRDYLDMKRKGDAAGLEAVVPGIVVDNDLGAEKVGERDVRFSGYIRRSDGRTIIWVNGATDMLGHADEGRLEVDSTASFEFEGRSQSLKAGQSWLVDLDKVKEAYQDNPTVNDM